MKPKSYGTTFGTIHTYRDLHMLQRHVDVSPAEPKFNFIEVTGMNGSIDLTESLDGIKYGDRLIKWTFDIRPTDDWFTEQSLVSNALNGKRFRIILDGDPSYFYDGRVKVNEHIKDRLVRQITVEATCKPYKLRTTLSTEPWLWNPFNFKTGVIYNDITNVSVPEDTFINLSVPIVGMPIVPTFITDKPLNVKFKNVVFDVPAGAYIVPDVVLSEEYSTVSLKSVDEPAIVSIQFRGGSL